MRNENYCRADFEACILHYIDGTRKEISIDFRNDRMISYNVQYLNNFDHRILINYDNQYPQKNEISN